MILMRHMSNEQLIVSTSMKEIEMLVLNTARLFYPIQEYNLKKPKFTHY